MLTVCVSLLTLLIALATMYQSQRLELERQQKSFPARFVPADTTPVVVRRAW
jgi:hypothetical protein